MGKKAEATGVRGPAEASSEYRCRVVALHQIRVAELQANPNNWRAHPQGQREALSAAMKELGNLSAITVRRSDDGQGWEIIDGHLRASLQPNDTVPCIEVDLSATEATKALLTIDPIAAMAEANAGALDALLREAEFGEAALQELVAGLAEDAGLYIDEDPAKITEDEVPEVPAEPITKPGDLWILGEHRVLCGDSTKAEDVARLMDGAKADLCFTSPPYGQQRDYTKEGKEKCQDWDGLMRGVFGNLPMADAGQVLVNLGMIHRDGEWIPYWDGWIAWMREQGWRRFGWYVWDKKHPMPMKDGGRLLPQHEWIFHFNKKHLDCNKTLPCVSAGRETGYGLRATDGGLGDSGRDITRSHRVLGSIVAAAANAGGSHDHPAVMSLDLPKQFIGLWSGRVYEPFCGSGTTLIAAEQLNRRCYGMEISPQYCDVIVKRWETLTGKKATLETR